MHKISHNRDHQRELVHGAPKRAIPGEAAATGRQRILNVTMANRRMNYLRRMGWNWIEQHHPEVGLKLRRLAIKKYPYRQRSSPVSLPVEEIEKIK